ncbi:eukaryotic translation initiation factor 5A-1-like isoform X2 [Babylonia areolata]|uniref:eukaryotic translation initiation factor 5A-1-like isoform X2 n=1 Tax=Babylonia areolata TaxID=304850 RepID=UPI003FD410A3
MRSHSALLEEYRRSTRSTMADDHDELFDTGASGASDTYPKQCSALRKNEFVMIKGHPCKIVEMSTSKTGKHGHAKVHIVAMDLFTNKKYEDICPSTHNVECPRVQRTEYQVVHVTDDGFLGLMDEANNQRDDLKLPDDETLSKEIREKADDDIMVTVLKAVKNEKVISIKKLGDSGK